MIGIEYVELIYGRGTPVIDDVFGEAGVFRNVLMPNGSHQALAKRRRVAPE